MKTCYYITKDNQGTYCITKHPTECDSILSKHDSKSAAINYFYDFMTKG